MSFRCQICGDAFPKPVVVGQNPEYSPQRVVTHTQASISRPGFDIVREVNACAACAALLVPKRETLGAPS